MNAAMLFLLTMIVATHAISWDMKGGQNYQKVEMLQQESIKGALQQQNAQQNVKGMLKTAMPQQQTIKTGIKNALQGQDVQTALKISVPLQQTIKGALQQQSVKGALQQQNAQQNIKGMLKTTIPETTIPQQQSIKAGIKNALQGEVVKGAIKQGALQQSFVKGALQQQTIKGALKQLPLLSKGNILQQTNIKGAQAVKGALVQQHMKGALKTSFPQQQTIKAEIKSALQQQSMKGALVQQNVQTVMKPSVPQQQFIKGAIKQGALQQSFVKGALQQQTIKGALKQLPLVSNKGALVQQNVQSVLKSSVPQQQHIKAGIKSALQGQGAIKQGALQQSFVKGALKEQAIKGALQQQNVQPFEAALQQQKLVTNMRQNIKGALQQQTLQAEQQAEQQIETQILNELENFELENVQERTQVDFDDVFVESTPIMTVEDETFEHGMRETLRTDAASITPTMEDDSIEIRETLTLRDSGTCNEHEWPDKDVSCGECKVLVKNFDTKYGGRCSTYCASIGKTCAGQWEELNDTCGVEFKSHCNVAIEDTSDAICKCSHEELDVELEVDVERNLADGDVNAAWLNRERAANEAEGFVERAVDRIERNTEYPAHAWNN